MLDQKKWVKKNKSKKSFSPKECCPKIKVKRKFNSKKNLRSKQFWIQKNLGTKIWV